MGQPLSHLLIKSHKAGWCVIAQGCEGRIRQYVGKVCQFFFKALCVGLESQLLFGQLLRGSLARLTAALQLLLQQGGFFLQGKQGVLPLFILLDAVL